jgi:hypothetical protein
MTPKIYLVPIAATLLLSACVHMPTGPQVMVLPGSGKDFDEFRGDDWACRLWAEDQVGTNPNRASADSVATGAVVGTALGAASGAAIGAASGDPATGAAVGAGAGLLGGSLVGAESGEAARWSIQHRYDMAYMQCMYVKGNQIPVPRGYQRPPPPSSESDARRYPPPPRGAPPPPPPDASY